MLLSNSPIFYSSKANVEFTIVCFGDLYFFLYNPIIMQITHFRVVTRYMVSGIKGLKKGGIRDLSL